MKNIFALYHEDGFKAVKVSGAAGGEYAGPCPFCGGVAGKSDRFHLWPQEGKGGRYWCRQCERKGDAIQYLREYRKLSYEQACELISVSRGPRAVKVLSATDAAPRTPAHEAWEPKPYSAPTLAWMIRAIDLIGRCINQLWSDENENILDWLRTSRMLTDEMILAAGLGYCPKELHLERATWGLPIMRGPKGRELRVWIPVGILIPTFQGKTVSRLKVRRFTEAKDKYIFIPGGQSVAHVIDNHRQVTMIVESELDAIVVNQEAGDLVNVAAMGSSTMRPDLELHKLIIRSSQVLVALDTEDSMVGAKAAWKWWGERYPSSLRCPIVKGKDPSAAMKNGLDLRMWIEAALAGGAQRMRA